MASASALASSPDRDRVLMISHISKKTRLVTAENITTGAYPKQRKGCPRVEAYPCVYLISFLKFFFLSSDILCLHSRVNGSLALFMSFVAVVCAISAAHCPPTIKSIYRKREREGYDGGGAAAAFAIECKQPHSEEDLAERERERESRDLLYRYIYREGAAAAAVYHYPNISNCSLPSLSLVPPPPPSPLS